MVRCPSSWTSTSTLAQRDGRGRAADRVGISAADLAVLKNGRAKAVRFTTLEVLCRVLECQPGDLLRWGPDAVEPS